MRLPRVLASALRRVKASSDAAPTTLRSRLRHCIPCAVDRGPRPGQSNGPGLPVLPSSRFWATIAPFTPDDDLFSHVWPPRGLWTVIPLELIHSEPDQPWIDRPWAWARFDQIWQAFVRDDPGIHNEPYTLGTWRVLDLEGR